MNNWGSGWGVGTICLVVLVAVIVFVIYRNNQKDKARRAEESRNAEARRQAEAKARAEATARAEAERMRAAKALVVAPEPAPLPVPGGNILEIAEEIGVKPVIDEHVHHFPQRVAPETRFEDLNRLLFIAYIFPDEKETRWPETLARDFATNLVVKGESEIRAHIAKRLRPKYPVIYDTLGYFAAASTKLEMSPDEPDLFADAYLALPPEKRPVVVSLRQPLANGKLAFYLYGFEPFEVIPAQLAPFGRDALDYILNAFTGERRDWKKLSIARMRQALGRQRREIEEQNRVKLVLEAETARLAHENRFVALFDLVERPSAPAAETAAPQPEAAT